LRLVQKLGFKAKSSEFTIQNIVGSCDVEFPIRVEGLVCSHGQFSSYKNLRFVISRYFSLFITDIFFLVVPWSYLPYDQAQGRAAYFHIGKDCINGRKGIIFFHFFSRVVDDPSGQRRDLYGFQHHTSIHGALQVLQGFETG
jgi:hypothetical protein